MATTSASVNKVSNTVSGSKAILSSSNGGGNNSTVSEKNPLDDDTRETRVIEVEKLFDAADPQKRGYLDRVTIRELMKALRNGHEVQEVPDTEVDALFVSFFGRTGAAYVDRDNFRRAMLNWLSLHDDRPHIFRIHKPARPLDRKRIHAEMGLFFNQFEPPSQRRILNPMVCPEDEVDRLRRGGLSFTAAEKEEALEKLKVATDHDGHMLVQAFEAVHSSDPVVVAQGLLYLRELTEALECFGSAAERFVLRYPIWSVLTALTTSPNALTGGAKPLPTVVQKLVMILDDKLVEDDLKTAACAVLHYVLLGARVPNTPPNNPLHSRNFLIIKHQLFTAGLLPLILKVIKGAQDSALRTWAIKAFASFAEQHTETLEAALREGFLDEIVGLMQQSSSSSDEDPAFFRASSYAVAVLCGHAHHHKEAQSALKVHISTLDYLEDPRDILRALWSLVNSTTDSLSLACLLLAVRHLIALTSPPQEVDYVHKLVEILSSAVRTLRKTLAAAKFSEREDVRTEQGQAAELLSASLLSLLDAMEDGKLMLHAMTRTRLLTEVHEILRLPTPFHPLTMLGLEMSELIGRQQHYAHVLQLADSLSVLLQREAHDSQLRIIRVLGCLSNAEPARIYELADYGMVGALFNTFRRFKQHDGILVGVYGLKDSNYNLDLVHGAMSVLRTILLVNDNRCRQLFLTVFSVSQVQTVMDTHRTICQDVLSGAVTPTQAIMDLNQALHSLLVDMRTLHGDSSKANMSSKAVTSLITESLALWRENLLELTQSPHPLTLPDLLDDIDPTTTMAARQPLIKCLDASGRPTKVRIQPEWPGVRDVDTLVPCTASLFELNEHIYDLYHFKKDGMRVFHVRSGATAAGGAGLPYELTEDAMLGSLLRLYGESKETLVVRVKSGIPIMRLSEEPLVTPASKHAVKLALQEAGLHITGRMSETIESLYKYFADVALDNPEAQGLKWDQFQKAVRWPGNGGSYTTPHGTKTRILWDLLDDASGSLSYQRMAVGLCTLMARQMDATLLLVHHTLERQPGAGVVKEDLVKFLLGIYSDRPTADARRLAEQMFGRWDRESKGALGYEGFREAVKENDRLLTTLTDLQEVNFFDPNGSNHHYQQRGAAIRRMRSHSQLVDDERVNPSHQHRSNRQHRRSRSVDFFRGATVF